MINYLLERDTVRCFKGPTVAQFLLIGELDFIPDMLITNLSFYKYLAPAHKVSFDLVKSSLPLPVTGKGVRGRNALLKVAFCSWKGAT